jgi:hypothetical protein
MKLIAFIKSLLPNFERSRIFQDVENMREQLNGKLKQRYADITALLVGKKALKSDFGKVNQLKFERVINPSRPVNYLEYTARVLELVSMDTKYFKELVEKYFDKQVAADGMSFVSGNVLQTINAAGFVVDYARRLVLASAAFETAELLAKRGGAEPGLTKAELQWLDKYREAFFETLKVFDIKPTDLKAKIESVPDMVVPPEGYDQLEDIVGGQVALDPNALGFIPLKYNPIYRIRLQIANYQVEKYRAQQAELECLELRLVALKYALNGKADPATEADIQDLEARISECYFKLEKMEADYA